MNLIKKWLHRLFCPHLFMRTYDSMSGPQNQVQCILCGKKGKLNG